MNAMRAAMERAGFAGYDTRASGERKVAWLAQNGLRTVLPIKQTRLHLGVVRTAGGVTICDERYVRRVGA